MNCEQKLMMETKTINQQLKIIMMIYKKVWFNNIVGMQFRKPPKPIMHQYWNIHRM